MIPASDLALTATALETAAAMSTSANPTPAGYWYRVCRAAETLAALSLSPSGLGEAYYIRRAAVALETVAGGSGTEETAGYWGDVKRVVDALELKGVVGSGSLANRLRAGAVGAVFGPTYDPDATTLFNRFTGGQGAEEKADMNTYIASLKSTGVWPRINQFIVPVNTGGLSDALLDWTGRQDAVAIGTPAHYSLEGFETNGVDSAIQLMSATQATLTSQDDISFALFTIETGQFASAPMGSSADASMRLNPRNLSDLIAVRTQGGNAVSSVTVASAAGLTHITRNGATLQRAYKDGVQVGADLGGASTTPSAEPITLGLSNGAYVAGYFLMAAVMRGVTAQQAADFEAATVAYFTARGAI